MSDTTGWSARLILWTFVFVMGVGVGAGLYETRILTPLWSGSPPESVWGWRDLLAANPQYAPHGSDKFWMFVTPARALLGVLLLVTALGKRGQQRIWRLIAGTLTLALFAVAAVWLIPMSIELFASEGRALNRDEVVSITSRYVKLNYVLQGLGVAAFLAGLRALSLEPVPRDP